MPADKNFVTMDSLFKTRILNPKQDENTTAILGDIASDVIENWMRAVELLLVSEVYIGFFLEIEFRVTAVFADVDIEEQS
jgi:hypothetical protein